MAERVIAHRECGRPRYQKGCLCPACVKAHDTAPHKKCPVCLAANRDYARRNKRLTVLNGGVPVEGAEPVGIRVERDPARLVETAVKQELDAIKGEEKMPGIAAAALAMARVLDDPTSVPQHPGAAGRLQSLMAMIRREKAPAAKTKMELLREKREAEALAGGSGA